MCDDRTLSDRPKGAFAVGEMVLLIDKKNRRYLFELEADGEFHSHAGVLGHAAIIGGAEGAMYTSSRGASFLALRPTLSEYILKMPRGAQVIYPKDLGPMLLLADIAPGMRVLESGIGSGALSMTMLRAGADIVGYELREDFADRAKNNVRRLLGEEALARYRIEIRDIYEGIDATEQFDRVLLDLPEPWRAIEHVRPALRSGGIVVAYTPSVTQVVKLREVLPSHGFGLENTVEVLNRGWHVEGQAVRPDHRMVAHTGFLTSARRLAD